jgi:nitroreductase
VDTYLAVASKRDWRSYADRPLPDDVVEQILDAGRLAGSGSNNQPWTFVVVESEDVRDRLAEAVYLPSNVLTAAFVVAIATPDGGRSLDVGRALQNMCLVAWNDGVVSCPNGVSDAERAAEVLGLEGDDRPVIVLTFGYPKRAQKPESKSAEEWSREANRRPLSDVVKRI